MIEPRGTNSDRVRFDISLYFTTTREKALSYHFETTFKTKKCARNDWIVVKITDTSTYWNWKSVRKWSFPFAYSNRVDEDRPWMETMTHVTITWHRKCYVGLLSNERTTLLSHRQMEIWQTWTSLFCCMVIFKGHIFVDFQIKDRVYL